MLMGNMIAFSQACYVAALTSAGVGASTLIAICVAPVIIAVFSAFITREHLTPITLIALFAALSGTMLLVGTRSYAGQATVSRVGIVLAFLSACGYAGFILCGRLLTNRYDPFQVSAVAFGTGALVLLVCATPTGLVLAYPAWGMGDPAVSGMCSHCSWLWAFSGWHTFRVRDGGKYCDDVRTFNGSYSLMAPLS